MMRKLFSKKTVDDTYEALQKRRKFIKRRSILLAMFVFGVNVFAWFIYISSAQMSFDAHVVSWDVNFFDENMEMHEATVDIENMKPGMDTFIKDIRIRNSSDIKANFSFEIDKAFVLGHDIMPSGVTSDDVLYKLKNEYPFQIYFLNSKSVLDNSDEMSFKVYGEWSYESAELTYFKLFDTFLYDPSIKYYQLSEGVYTAVNVTSETYDSLKSSLYVEKDDADSLFGNSCKTYKDGEDKPCVSFHIKLKVTQVSE